jgi:hypothetical protein
MAGSFTLLESSVHERSLTSFGFHLKISAVEKSQLTPEFLDHIEITAKKMAAYVRPKHVS